MKQDASSQESSTLKPAQASWWRTLFVSRHTLFLENLLAEERDNRVNLLAQQRSDFESQINVLRSRYSDEVAFLRERLREVNDELERTRIFISPPMQAIQTRAEAAVAEAEAGEPETVVRMTPLQMALKKEQEADHERFLKEQAEKKPRTAEELMAAEI